MVNEPILVPASSLIRKTGLGAFLSPPKLCAMLVGDDASGVRWLDRPILVTSKVLSVVGTIARLAVTRKSMCKNFLVAAVLFQPLFKPTPKPLNNGSA